MDKPKLTEEELLIREAQFRQDLIDGVIDPGPNVYVTENGKIRALSQDTDSVRSDRDLRDPVELGRRILVGVQPTGLRATEITAVDMADLIDAGAGGFVANYQGDDSMARLTLAARRAELEQRAAAGDRFAMALLSGDTLAEDPVD